MVKLGRKQKRHAKTKGVAGVCLPSVRCIWFSMGGAVTSIENQGFGGSTTWTGSGFEKISAVHWTLTSRDGGYWVVGHNNGEFGAWTTGESTDWAWYRCVRTIE